MLKKIIKIIWHSLLALVGFLGLIWFYKLLKLDFGIFPLIGVAYTVSIILVKLVLKPSQFSNTDSRAIA